MTIGAISAAGLSQAVFSSSNSTQQQQILKTLGSSLESGDLSGAQSAFQSLQTFLQSEASASGGSLSSDSQLSSDLSALGSAISSGDAGTAQSALATVEKDLKSSSAPGLANEMSAASESMQLVEGILSPLNNSSSSASGTSSLLESVYGGSGGLNVVA